MLARKAFHHGVALAVDGPLAADFDVVRAGHGNAVDRATRTDRIVLDVVIDQQRRAFVEMQIDSAGERERTGQKSSFGDYHGSASCGGEGIDRFLNCGGIRRGAVGDRAAIQNIDGFVDDRRQCGVDGEGDMCATGKETNRCQNSGCKRLEICHTQPPMKTCGDRSIISR